MVKKNETAIRAIAHADNTITDAQLRGGRDRVRLVRRLSKWLTKLDTITADAGRLQRDGVQAPDGWGFDFDEFYKLTNSARKYILACLRAATDPNGGRA